MPHDNWTCVMVQNGPGILPDAVQLTLQEGAVEHTYRQEESMFMETSVLSGHLSTEWKPYIIGSRSGIFFRALVDYDRWNDCQINFLMRRDLLNIGVERLRRLEAEGVFERFTGKDRLPVPEFYQFASHPKPYRSQE